jgi:two-component system, OmpR family, response regulator
MSKVLVVEDNQPLAKSLQSWLSKHYEVTLVTTGHQAIKELTINEYDAVLLDLGLPDMSGQEVCSEVRHKGIKTPILVLTATDDVGMKVNMLDIGADDYLLKPFYVGELKARLRAMLRRNNSATANILKVGDLVLDPDRRQVRRGELLIELRRKEFDILEYLMQNRGTRAMIINNSWDPGADRWNNTVDVHIKYLRDKIDRPFAQKLIKTAYGVGYMIDDAT